MSIPRSTIRATHLASLLLLALVALTAQGRADEGTGAPGATVLSAEDALKAMSGMAGYYRVTPKGETLLYPEVKPVSEMHGMFGTYRVTPHGILLQPSGMSGRTMAVSAMGGSNGTFRIVPRGNAYFYPYGD